MKGLLRLVMVQAKLFLREPAAFFFTIVFPALLLIIFGAIFGNEPMTEWGLPLGYIDLQVPALAAIILGSIAFIGIPIAVSSARETGVLRRYRATPVPALAIIAADVAVNFAMAVAGMAILVLLGKALFGLRFAGSWALALASFALCALALFAAGYVIASLSPTARVAQTVGMALFFPLMFLSGAAIPRQIMSEKVRDLADWLPLTHAVELMQGVWLGRPLTDHAVQLAVLAALLLVGTAVSARAFRWE